MHNVKGGQSSLASPKDRAVEPPVESDSVDVDARIGIQSVEIASAILTAMAQFTGPAALKDIARGAGLSSAKVHRYLVSLVRAGFAVQEESGSYAIGPQAVAIGMAGLRALSPVKVAPPFLRQLRDVTGESSLLAIWSARGPVVVDLEDSGRPIFMNIRPGSLLPVGATATGQVFGAFLPAGSLINVDGVMKTIEHELGKQGAALVEQIQHDGVATVHGTLVSGASAMSAPVFDYRGRIAAVIGLIAHSDNLQGDTAAQKANVLRATANAFSARLGGRTTSSHVA